VVYRGQRRVLGSAGASYQVRVRLGAGYQEQELEPLDCFLTERYRLYSSHLGRLIAVDVWHPPWPLRRAEALEVRQDLIEAAGLPAPTTPPLTHASPGVPVHIGRPKLVTR